MHAQARVYAAALVAASVLACSSADITEATAPMKPRFTSMAAASLTPTSTALLSTTAQEIKGWGIYPAAGGNPFWERGNFENAVYAVNANLVRDQIDPALYVSGTSLPTMQLNMTLLNQYVAKLQSAKNHGITGYILSVWSPPAQWKTNGSILGQVNNNVGYLDSASEDAFVSFVTKVVLTLRGTSVGTPIAISIQNEPAHVAPYGGCMYSVTQWQRVLQKVRGSFDYNGIPYVKLFGPETGQYTPAIYANYITNTPGYLGGPNYPSLNNNSYMNHAVGAYAFHTYAMCSLTQTVAAMQAHPKDAWMTEYGNPAGTTELDWTLDMLGSMAANLVIIPNNYWFWWMGYNVQSGNPPFGVLLTGTTTITYSKRYWALQKLWGTVKPGWHVKYMTSSDTSMYVAAGTQDPCVARVRLMAFLSPDGATQVVLAVNPTNNPKVIQIGNLVGTATHTWRTDAWRDMQAFESTNIYNGFTTITIPSNTAVIAQMN